jgi:hypothetical protein
MGGRFASAALCLSLWVACTSDLAEKPRAERTHRGDTDAAAADGGEASELPFTSNSSGPPALCARERNDVIHDLFCGESQPAIGNLVDLMTLVKANPVSSEEAMMPPSTPLAYQRYVAVLGHSTALSGHLVSPINPRAIVLGRGTLVAFQRGVQRVELATVSRANGNDYNFYLVSFEQACNASKNGCNPGDLYTPKIESDWTRSEIRDDEDLKNTPLDCKQCHQRGLDRPTLLMREIESPWTHFFLPADTGIMLPGVNGTDLTRDFLVARGHETYAGFDVTGFSVIAPFVLQTTVPPAQPVFFDSPKIQLERYPQGSDGDQTEAQPSPTWEKGYEAFKRGEQLALPYLDARATDPIKQVQLTAAYVSYRAGEISADELPELSDIFPDDGHLRARMGLQTEPDATPPEALIQACGSCHNDVLDQTISRSHFNIDLSRLDRAELETAIARIRMPRNAPGAMPPPEARQLDPDARDRLLEFLRDDPAALEPNEQLKHAASLGMKGGEGVARYL